MYWYAIEEELPRADFCVNTGGNWKVCVWMGHGFFVVVWLFSLYVAKPK